MIFVTGDCHGNFERFKPEYFPEQAQMTKRDIVICAGDFGGVWFGDGRDEAALDWLESLPFTLAFVCGNHENYDALERYPVDDWHGGMQQRVLLKTQSRGWPPTPASMRSRSGWSAVSAGPCIAAAHGHETVKNESCGAV